MSTAEKTDVAYRTAALEIMWICLHCGAPWYRGIPLPKACPSCGAPGAEFVLVAED